MEESKPPEGFTRTGSIPWDSSWPRFAGEHDRRLLLSYLEKRFGIPEKVFAGLDLFGRRKSWWLLRKTATARLPCRLKVSQIGLRAFDRVGNYLKPATRMVQLFGHHAIKAVYWLTDSELDRILKAEPLEVGSNMEDGFVILRYREHVLGAGLQLQGRITSRIRLSEVKRMVSK